MYARFPLVLGMLLSLAVCSGPVLAHESSAKGVTVAHPWARATPGGAKIGAAYMTVVAAPGTSDTLVGAASDAAERVELHSHIMDGDVMKMRQVANVEIGSGKTILFQPSGYHVMLINLKTPLKEGDVVKMTLKFKNAGDISVDASVEPIGAKGPHGLDYQPNPDGSNPSTGGPAPAGAHHHH